MADINMRRETLDGFTDGKMIDGCGGSREMDDGEGRGDRRAAHVE